MYIFSSDMIWSRVSIRCTVAMQLMQCLPGILSECYTAELTPQFSNCTRYRKSELEKLSDKHPLTSASLTCLM